MRTTIRTAAAVAALAAVTGLSAAGPVLAAGASAAPGVGHATEGGPVRVVFARPERFTDAGDRPPGGVGADDPALAELVRFVQAEAGPRLAGGQTLEVTVTDLDRAGEFEPRRGPNLDRVRIVRDVTPPRLDLAFRLLAADGQVVKSGTRSLRNLNFLARQPVAPRDPMRHEKRLLADWIAQDLR